MQTHREGHDEHPSGHPRGVTRRSMLAGVVGAAGAAMIGDPLLATGRQTGERQEPVDPTTIQGAPPSALGQRSTFEEPRRAAAGARSQTPLQDLHGIITPSDLHFERHHAGIPRIDPRQYGLVIHGMVDRPRVFTLADLKRFPSRSLICFVECAGNGGAAYTRQPNPSSTPQQIDGLLSTSEWVGVPLRTLFREVGVRAEASWFLAEGMDAARMTRSIPVDKGWDDAMIAYAQNGEAIRPEQGYPARLLLPGWEGNANVKWIRRIELSDRPFMTREETSKYSDPLKDGTARQFSFVMDAKSIITDPVYPRVLESRGWQQISGLAWSGRGVIERVEVSMDGGRTWEMARLHDPVLPKCATRFTTMWNWQGREAVLMSRAYDETGYVQPSTAQLQEVRGIGTHYHFNNIRVWTVKEDGSVIFGGGS